MKAEEPRKPGNYHVLPFHSKEWIIAYWTGHSWKIPAVQLMEDEYDDADLNEIDSRPITRSSEEKNLFKCPTCNGVGSLHTFQDYRKTCPQCKGYGESPPTTIVSFIKWFGDQNSIVNKDEGMVQKPWIEVGNTLTEEQRPDILDRPKD